MKKKESIKIITIIYIVILFFIIFLNIRDYYLAMEEAKNYIKEGKTILAEESINYAHSRIRGIFIILSFSILILYFLRRKGSLKSE
jgi:hypothetical protein